jgi:hypothetical protein
MKSEVGMRNVENKKGRKAYGSGLMISVLLYLLPCAVSLVTV